MMLAQIGEENFHIFNFTVISVAGKLLKFGEILQILADSRMGEIEGDHFMLLAERGCEVREHSPILKALVPVGNNNQTIGFALSWKM
ncbi:hypothetical protein D3C71_2097620 [compost metagenome]